MLLDERYRAAELPPVAVPTGPVAAPHCRLADARCILQQHLVPVILGGYGRLDRIRGHEKGCHLRDLRWLAVVPAVLGLLFLFVALLWTAWTQFYVGVGLLALASVIWRTFAGDWPLSSAGSKHPA